jgi:hypothetical protein
MACFHSWKAAEKHLKVEILFRFKFSSRTNVLRGEKGKLNIYEACGRK